MDEAFVAEAAVRLGSPLVLVPAGPFLMGTDVSGAYSPDRFEHPRHSVMLPAYAIGRSPVTNAEYARFIAAGGYATPRWWTEYGWEVKESGNVYRDDPARRPPAWTGPENWGLAGWDAPDQPVTGVNWYEADAYCRWLSHQSGLTVTLPSEAEWEKAARGTDGRRFPWGEWAPTADRCTFGRSWTDDRPTPVGAHSPQGDSPYGCADMVGNVREWTCSRFAPYPFQAEPRVTAMTVVSRGASWCFGAESLHCAKRFGHNNRAMRERDGHVMRSADESFRIAVLGPA
ncbi:MAG TPA: SUMF1/EgtB/PvdO family nonheme iron enzyme [Herpetosiphonaceae bacterium]|nr:SUMF1/EgtB/PvdO family nonheme iron enzyme [Herpetosiphonaceae bacterium]